MLSVKSFYLRGLRPENVKQSNRRTMQSMNVLQLNLQHLQNRQKHLILLWIVGHERIIGESS